MEAKKRNIGVLYGGIAGLFLILFTALLWTGGVELSLGWIARLGYLVLIGLAVTATLKQRKANGGRLDFQEALKTAFAVLALALLAQTIFTWIFLNFIDPHLKAILSKAILEKDEAAVREMRLSTEVMERTLAEGRGKDQFSFSSMSLGFASSCIPQFIVALLIAAIVRKKKIDTNAAGS